MKEIELTQSKIALVDDEDFPKLSKFKWHAWYSGYSFYAVCCTRRHGKIYMHREILGLKKNDGKIGDHINHNSLDNQKLNLRVATARLNSYNCKFKNNNTSGYRGVTWHKQINRWMAQIKVNNKRIYLGVFTDIIKAALAYDFASLEYYKENAILNFPERLI